MVMTVLLTMTAMYGSLSIFTPQISYTTKMDNWMLACIIFVLTPLIELVVALSLKSSSPGQPSKVTPKTPTRYFRNKPSPDEKARKLDRFSLVAFVVAFSIFNVVYWVELLGL